ncbi:site-specific integrase [Phycicoccus sp. DTK01]|uniref:site-specific integrase n=1 Tax=Phycicoccus sp. DTK01 TaxID=2785745 RepID=UPI001A8E34FE|nr:site-specific integrase [Phycicoccus sp. DTK01]GIL37718.1 hypothetical protein PDTK01_37930 [Phycicoccus sp. DTK01]
MNHDTTSTQTIDTTALAALVNAAVRDAMAGANIEPLTIAEVASEALERMSEGSHRAHKTYIDLLTDGWQHPNDPSLRWAGLGALMAHEVRTKDLDLLLGAVQARAALASAQKRTQRLTQGRTEQGVGGASAKNNAISAWRAVFKYAAANHHIDPERNPSQNVVKVTRGNSSRRPLKAAHLDSLLLVARSTGDDPELDELICWFFLITGARRNGLLALTRGDINKEECTVALHEKHKKADLQPVPDWFIDVLLEFADSRGATGPEDQIFRKKASRKQGPRPITSRRLDNLFQRIQTTLSWADQAQVTAHTLRHHAIGVVAEASRPQVGRAFARHTASSDAHFRYAIGTPEEVAAVVIRLHGGNHPWVTHGQR